MTTAPTTAHEHGHATTPALTRNQQLVLAVLEKARGPLGAYALLDELRGDGFKAPLQVYRALEKLQEAGFVHRLDSLNAFVACVHPHCHASRATAFAICEKCGTVVEFGDEAVDARLSHWAEATGFRPAKTTIEIKGLCAVCGG